MRASGPLPHVQDGSAGAHGVLGVGDMREQFVRHLDPPAALLGRLLARRDDGGDPLSDVPDRVVQDAGVVGVLGGVLVPGAGVQRGGGVLMGEDGVHAGDPQRGGGVDGEDAGVRMRGAEELHVEQPGDLDVEGVAGGARHDLGPRRSAEALAHGFSRAGAFGVLHAADGVLDGAIAGAPA